MANKAARRGIPDKTAPQASVADVLDRVLDRGIVIDAWVRVSVAGIGLIDVDARVVVASIDTYVQHAHAVGPTPLAARPQQTPGPSTAIVAPATAPLTPARRRPRRRTRVRLRCADGCTFLRSARRRPATVRCPADRGRACPVTVLTA
jgi:hypothetical protein